MLLEMGQRKLKGVACSVTLQSCSKAAIQPGASRSTFPVMETQPPEGQGGIIFAWLPVPSLQPCCSTANTLV